MLAVRRTHTDTQTCSLQYFATAPTGEVTCRSNIVECYKSNNSFDKVKCCFDKVGCCVSNKFFVKFRRFETFDFVERIA